MKRFLLALVLPLAFAGHARATWSVVAVDRESGQMVIASATCVPQDAFARFPAKGLKDIQAVIVHGYGIAAAQANVDRTRRMQSLISAELRSGTSPSKIVDLLKSEDERHPSRQYGIVDLQGRAAGYSGAENGKESLDRQGHVEGTQIHFSIQGNILAGAEVIEDAVMAFRSTEGTLADRVMAAMETADARGGDRRCTCDTKPDPPAPCTRKTAHVAYLVVINRNDRAGEGLNDGDYSLELDVNDKNVQADEDDNPVKTLRLRYDHWKAAQKR